MHVKPLKILFDNQKNIYSMPFASFERIYKKSKKNRCRECIILPECKIWNWDTLYSGRTKMTESDRFWSYKMLENIYQIFLLLQNLKYKIFWFGHLNVGRTQHCWHPYLISVFFGTSKCSSQNFQKPCYM
jgi:hypothetical protein